MQDILSASGGIAILNEDEPVAFSATIELDLDSFDSISADGVQGSPI